ncbi:MAG: RDD family protein [Verrucomicrobiota bacterium]
MSSARQGVGFWRRAVAWLLDMMWISVVAFLLADKIFGIDVLPRGPNRDMSMEMMLRREAVLLCAFIFWLLYCTAMEICPTRGSLGKMVMQIKVTDRKGRRLKFGHALARNLLKVVSALPLGLGFFWTGWDDRKQAWHDKMTKSYIVNK